MKWRALAVAMVGVSAILASCSFDDAWTAYCGHPGRCSKLNDGAAIPIAQSTTRQIVLTGQDLFDASTVAVVPPVATASIASSDGGQVVVDVTVNHGVAVDTRFTLQVGWERSEDGLQESPPLVVTPIWVAAGGKDDAGGFGTPDAPFATLPYASQVSGYGDTIRLGPGRFGGIDPTGSCDPDAGLKPGVAVQGESPDASVVEGPGLCGFNLSEGAQAVRQLTLFGFSEGIRATDAGAGGGGRSTVSDVSITGCSDAGVVATAGAWLQLDRVDLVANSLGLRVTGADVVMQDGGVSLSPSNGVLMDGNGGRLVLAGVDVNNNAGANTGDPVQGAGILLAADAGKVAIGGGAQSHDNGYTGIAVAGLSNEVTLDGVSLQGGNLGLLVQDRDAGVFLSHTDIASDGDCIRVASFRFFNGGTGTGQYGQNTLACGTYNINDTRTSSGPPMDFERTSLFTGVNTVTPTAGTNVTASDPTLRILLNGPTQVQFH